MAQLGIRDKNYRPNQYINPMLISQKKEPAMGYGPYKIFDKNNPEHPDYKADDDDDEDIQLSLPIDYVSAPQDGKIPTRLFYNRPYKNPEMFIKDKQMIEDAKERFKGLTGIDLAHNRKNQDMTIAGVPNFPGGGFGSTSGAFVDLSGEAYFLIDGELIPQGGYDPAKHGDLIPHGGPDIPQAMNNQGMMISMGGPELGGTGRKLTLSEFRDATDNAFSNLMNSDMTDKDFEDYLDLKKRARRQMFDGV